MYSRFRMSSVRMWLTNGDESEQTLANAPGEKDNMFVVPKTFD